MTSVGDFTRLNFDEGLRVQSCLGIPSDPWEPGLLCRMVLCLDTDLPFTMVTSAWIRKESPWLLPSLPLWLWRRQQTRSTPLLQEEGEASAFSCWAQSRSLLSSALHGALIFTTPMTKGVGDIPMELAVLSFFCLRGKSCINSLFNSQLRENMTTGLSSKYLELVTISVVLLLFFCFGFFLLWCLNKIYKSQGYDKKWVVSRWL